MIDLSTEKTLGEQNTLMNESFKQLKTGQGRKQLSNKGMTKKLSSALNKINTFPRVLVLY